MRKGVTVVEVAIVVAILLIAAAIVIPVFRQSRGISTEASALGGFVKVDVPPGWRTVDSLNPLAQLKIGDPEADVYLIVVSETKQDSKVGDIVDYSKFTRDRLKASLKGAADRGPWWTTVGGYRGLRYEVVGVSQDGMSLVYLHTIVETPQYFHQIVGWAEALNFEKHRNTLRKVSDSLREGK